LTGQLSSTKKIAIGVLFAALLEMLTQKKELNEMLESIGSRSGNDSQTPT